MKVLFALPGLHRYNRGAETAFISVAKELVLAGDSVTLIGSGDSQSLVPYRFLRADSVARETFESFPAMPLLRNECIYEELTFAPALLRRYRPSEYDVTVTCSYPFVNWVLRRPSLHGRPPHVFVTQNGDWPVHANNYEYRFFGCEGVVCTNPDFYERNKDHWFCRMIPNGVDCERFRPGEPQRSEFGLPTDRPIILMVSALIASKRVECGIEAVGRIPEAHLVIAGDGPLRGAIDALADRVLPGRYTRVQVSPGRMPALYRSADVFLHLSKEESFGNVFVEAMACGIPVVAHDSPRSRWLVGETEFLLDTDDPKMLAEHIELACRATEAQREARVKRAQAFSWPTIGKMYREFLGDVIANSKSNESKKTGRI
ncbi:glycosyltransferase family 4 protein [Bradyrhizobium erythrophlei]|uniref:Glycosyltransferase involved in cell wall bisynthesis n=1 Tax=Bradyrhizobium erythrophlei TaxID=1437360 RepID=A0A1M5PBT2_9BRAD|nr:glycosyltransferase family 4 protein [Bradyrhizobium erythrophlei]SHG99304.1 Glycosyltransferase involved in cell wall bisynthesis [Bradyrhizobium erythrophlei]